MPTGVDPFLKTPAQVGLLAGVSDGMRMQYGLADLDRQFRDSDLDNQRKQNLYANELADNPLRDVERQVKMNAGGLTNEMYDNGQMRQRFDDETGLGSAKTEAAQTSVKAAKALEAIDDLQRNGTYFLNPKITLEDEGKYAEQAKQWTAMGVKNLPKSILGPANQTQLKGIMESAIRSREHLQKLALMGQQHEYTKDIHNLDNKAAGERAGTMAAAQAAKAEVTGNAFERAVKSVDAKVKDGQPVDAEDIKAVAATMTKTDAVVETRIAQTYRSAILLKQGSPTEFATLMKELGVEDKKYTVNSDAGAIAEEAASRKYQKMQIEKAYEAVKAPKIEESEALKLFGDNPEYLMRLAKSGNVIPSQKSQNNTTIPAKTANKTQSPPKVTSGERESVLAKYRKKYPTWSDEKIISALEQRGVVLNIPSLTKPSIPVDPYVPLDYQGVD